jgi:hypothetical protein
LIPLRILHDRMKIFRHEENIREDAVLAHSVALPPSEGFKIKLPVHPFALVAHFNIHWVKLTLEQQTDCLKGWTGEQERRVDKATYIWSLWHPSTSEIKTRQDDNFSEEGSTFKKYDGDQDPTNHQSRKRSRPDGQGGRSEKAKSGRYNTRHGKGQQRRAAGSATQGATLVDDVIDFKSDHRKWSATSDSDIIATEDEYEEESNDDYNPLPQYSDLYKLDVNDWANGVMEGFEELQQLGKPMLSGIDCGRRVREYAKEAAQAPPTGDWTQWKADTAHLWAEFLPARKLHKLSGIPGHRSLKLAPKFRAASPAVSLSSGEACNCLQY